MTGRRIIVIARDFRNLAIIVVVVLRNAVVVVSADVKVEVEKAAVEFAVMVPVAGGVQPEPDRADHHGPQRDGRCPARNKCGRVTNPSHHWLPGSVPDPAQPAVLGEPEPSKSRPVLSIGACSLGAPFR
jgi:hypothetical protein